MAELMELWDDELPDPEMMIFCNPRRAITVQARPMVLEDYLDMRGWADNGHTDLRQEGYLVERPDMGPPNHSGFDHFIAWLPRQNFERFYEKVGNPNS